MRMVPRVRTPQTSAVSQPRLRCQPSNRAARKRAPRTRGMGQASPPAAVARTSSLGRKQSLHPIHRYCSAAPKTPPASAARVFGYASAIPREGAGSGGVAVDGCVPNVDVDVSKQRHWPLPEPRARFSMSSRRVLRPAGPGCLPRTTKPLRGGRSQLRSQKRFHFCRTCSFGLARPCRHGHRSPARPHDASRQHPWSGGTSGRISEVLGEGIDCGFIPAMIVPRRHARPCGEHPRLEHRFRPAKTWVVGTSPTMTGRAREPRGTLSCIEVGSTRLRSL